MAYINPKLDYKEGDILYGSDLNASNLVIKNGVDDNYDKIKDIEVFNTELDTNITNLEGALEENVNALEQSIADNVTALEQSIADNLEKIEAVERFTTDLESDINTLASGATPIATKHTRGFVQVGDNLNVDSNGVISGKDPYVLPIATDNVIGGVSIGANIDTDGNGKISVKGVKGSDNISVVEQDGNYHIAYTGGNFKKEIVEELPPVGKDDVIYLLRKDTASGSDIYDEYLWIDGVWNPIGSTDVDLANYYDKATVDEKLDAKADKGDVGGKEVFVSSTQPSDTSMQIWIDESEDGSTFDPTSFYKKEETDELLEELDTTLTEYVDTAISELDTTSTEYVDTAISELDTTLTEYVDTAISELDLDLPIASSEILGGIKVGENLEIDENGILSAIAEGGIKVLTGTSDNPIYIDQLGYGVFITTGQYYSKTGSTVFGNSGDSFWVLTSNRCLLISMAGSSGTTGHQLLRFNYSDLKSNPNYFSGSYYNPNIQTYLGVINNLTSTSANTPLSANQGKVLKDLIDGLNHIPLLPASPTNKIYLTELPIGLYIATSPLYWTPNSTTSFESSSGPALYIKHEENKVYSIFLTSNGFNCYYSDNITSKSKKSLFIQKPTDNLTSTSTVAPLSANQGKVLKGLVDDLQTQINNLPTGGSGSTTLGENITNSSSITLSESFENFSEIDVYLHNEDKTIEEKVTIVNPRQSYLAYEKVISHVDLGVFYMLEYFINYDSTTTLSVTGNTGKAIDDTVTTVTSANMPTLYIGKVVGR